MKIFIACSKHFYEKVLEIKTVLENQGHIVTVPNCFDDPFKEDRLRNLSEEEHRKFKQSMMKLHEPKIKENDAILVLNFEKKGQQNYIGGATFMEIATAWRFEKKIFFYNPIPENIFTDEIKGMNPTIIYGNLSKLKEEIKSELPKKIGVGVGVMVLNKERKILLGLRSEDKSGSAFKLTSCWTMPGGKLEYDENFEECAKREVLEETGIELKNIKVICINDNKNEHARYVTIGFLSEDCKDEPKIMEPDEITEWKWFDLNNLPENMYFPSTKLLENYKQNKFYLPEEKKELQMILNLIKKLPKETIAELIQEVQKI